MKMLDRQEFVDTTRAHSRDPRMNLASSVLFLELENNFMRRLDQCVGTAALQQGGIYCCGAYRQTS